MFFRIFGVILVEGKEFQEYRHHQRRKGQETEEQITDRKLLTELETETNKGVTDRQTKERSTGMER